MGSIRKQDCLHGNFLPYEVNNCLLHKSGKCLMSGGAIICGLYQTWIYMYNQLFTRLFPTYMGSNFQHKYFKFFGPKIKLGKILLTHFFSFESKSIFHRRLMSKTKTSITRIDTLTIVDSTKWGYFKTVMLSFPY